MIARVQMAYPKSTMTSWHPSRAPLLALALAVAIAAAGCGSSHGSSTTSTPCCGFLTQFGAACRIDVAGIRSAPKTVAGEAPVQTRFIRTLQAIKPPAALRPAFTQYIALLQQNLAAFEHHDVATGKRLRTEIAPVLAKLRKAGVTGC